MHASALQAVKYEVTGPNPTSVIVHAYQIWCSNATVSCFVLAAPEPPEDSALPGS